MVAFHPWSTRVVTFVTLLNPKLYYIFVSEDIASLRSDVKALNMLINFYNPGND